MNRVFFLYILNFITSLSLSQVLYDSILVPTQFVGAKLFCDEEAKKVYIAENYYHSISPLCIIEFNAEQKEINLTQKLNFKPYRAINSIKRFNGNLYVAGVFRATGEEGNIVTNLGIWNDRSLKEVLNVPMNYPYEEIKDMEIYNNELIIVGDFDTFNGNKANDIVKYDGKLWYNFVPYKQVICNKYNLDTNTVYDQILDICVHDHKIYVLVSISNVNFGNHYYVLFYENGEWRILIDGYLQKTNKIWDGFFPNKLCFYRNELYLSGIFYSNSSANIGYVPALRWDGEKWDRLGLYITSYNTSFFGDMVVSKDKLYFSSYSNSKQIVYEYQGNKLSLNINGIVSWNGESWCAIGVNKVNSNPIYLSTCNNFLYFSPLPIEPSHIYRIIDDSQAECTPKLRSKPEEQSWEEGISLYPNPTQNQFSLEFKNVELPNFQAQVKIFNVLGQEVHNQMLFEVYPYTQHTLNVGYLRAGTYFVQVSAGDKTVMKKLVVTR